MWRIDSYELSEYLDEIFECDAFELHKSAQKDGKQDFYIPYMMNDALECYLILKHATMTGTYLEDCKDESSVELVETDKGPAAIFRQGRDNVFTIWYEHSYCEQKCYRYDQIGHFWVEGEEHWRRLVYIVGTIHDKFRYMGEEVCNEKERALMPLMEFGPFRYYTPLHDPLDDYYEESEDGFACMKALAEEADDREFLRLMKLYELTPFKQQMTIQLANAMQNPKRIRLYEHIFEKIREAAAEYPERTYPENIQTEIEAKRKEAESLLRSNGFTGTYPLFHKGAMQVYAMEEHPFTILEWEHYEFKIQYMVSEIDADDVSNWANESGEYPKHAGFFKKKGNRSRIARDLMFLGS